MEDFIEILRCPITHGPVTWSADRASIVAANGSPAYRYTDGVARFLDQIGDASEATKETRDFYEEEGWSDDDAGHCNDTSTFVDTRPTSLSFTRRCMTRLGKYFAKGGRYLLDAGSGPIVHSELLDYGAKFDRRVCVDLSPRGLQGARAKLGDRGIYLQGDLTNLPVATGSMDAVTCNHVIYQLAPEHQAAAFTELWRVLKPGGVAVAVYWWPEAPLEQHVRRVVRALRLIRVLGRVPRLEEDAYSGREPTHCPQSVGWFESQPWPFQYDIDTFRVITNSFMKEFIPDDWRGRTMLNALYGLQQIAPRYCGRRGVIPAIVIRKAEA